MGDVKIEFSSPWHTCHTKTRDTFELREIIKKIDGVVKVDSNFDYSFIFLIGECFDKEVVKKEITVKVNLYQKENGVSFDQDIIQL